MADHGKDIVQLPTDDDVKSLLARLDEHFKGAESKVCVLGIDIYQYSRYDAPLQRLIPAIFKFNYDLATSLCSERETFLFQRHKFAERFISTGDGGFMLFDTPLHALVFAAYFQSTITSFNGYLTFPVLQKAVGPINLRYAITYDSVFMQDADFYGSAIISNARILSRDALNRCLVDAATVSWFNAHTVNVEGLLTLTRANIATMPVFSDYEPKESNSIFFSDSVFAPDSAFKAVHLQKVGVVTVKSSQHDVYNLYVQVGISRRRGGDEPMRPVTVTLGNLNTAGISA